MRKAVVAKCTRVVSIHPFELSCGVQPILRQSSIQNGDCGASASCTEKTFTS